MTSSDRPPSDQVLLPEEAAAVLEWPTERVIDAAQRGTLPGVQIGCYWRFARRALSRAVADPSPAQHHEELRRVASPR